MKLFRRPRPLILTSRIADLSPRERSDLARRMRLEWASGGDRDHAAGVARMVADGERATARNGRPPAAFVGPGQ